MENFGTSRSDIPSSRKGEDRGHIECSQLYSIIEIALGIMCRDIVIALKSDIRNNVYLNDKICQECQKCLQM